MNEILNNNPTTKYQIVLKIALTNTLAIKAAKSALINVTLRKQQKLPYPQTNFSDDLLLTNFKKNVISVRK